LNTDLSLSIGGITALIRSGSVALSRVVDWHRPFVYNGDGHDILIDLVDSPRQGRRHVDKIPAADVDRLGQHLQRQLEWEGRLVPGRGSETALQPVLEVVGQCWDLDRFRRAWDALASDPERHVLLELYGKSLLFLDRQENAASIFFPGASSLVGVALSGVLFRHLQLIFALLMGNFAGLMLHAAGVVKEGRGYAFVGPSGSGKTTLASSMEGDALVLADDGLIVRQAAGEFRVFATPWNILSGAWSSSVMSGIWDAPLRLVAFLCQDRQDRMVRLQASAATVMLLGNALPPLRAFSAADSEKALELAAGLCGTVPCYEMCLAQNGDVWRLIDGECECDIPMR
jgi:hypothetical protein